MTEKKGVISKNNTKKPKNIDQKGFIENINRI